MHKCELCKEYVFSGNVCHCKPFTISSEGEETTIYAFDEQDAAKQFAKNYNEDGDYSLMNKTKEIEVTGDSDEKKKFKISAEPDIYYSADEI